MAIHKKNIFLKFNSIFIIILLNLFIIKLSAYAAFNYRGTFVANRKTDEVQSYYILLKENKNVTFTIKKISGDECKDIFVRSIKLTSDENINTSSNKGIKYFNVPVTGIYEVSVFCNAPTNKSVSYDLNVLEENLVDILKSNNNESKNTSFLITSDEAENLEMFVPEKEIDSKKGKQKNQEEYTKAVIKSVIKQPATNEEQIKTKFDQPKQEFNNVPNYNQSYTSISSAKIIEDSDESNENSNKINNNAVIVDKQEKYTNNTLEKNTSSKTDYDVIENKLVTSVAKEDSNISNLVEHINLGQNNNNLTSKVVDAIKDDNADNNDTYYSEYSELDPDAPAVEEESSDNKISSGNLKYSGKLNLLDSIDVFSFSNEKNKSWPQSICYDDEGNLWYLDCQLCRVICFNKKGKELVQFGSKGQGKNEFGIPVSLAVFKKYVLVGDRKKNSILIFDKKGYWINSIQSDPNVGLTIYNPVAINVCNDEIWVGEARTNRILCFDKNFLYLGSFGSNDECQIDSISSIFADKNSIYILQEDGEIKKFGIMGNFISSFSTHSNYSTFLFIDENKNFWITDIELGKAICYSPKGEILFSINRNSLREILSNNTKFAPSSISINSDSKIAIADTYSKQIKIFEIK